MSLPRSLFLITVISLVTACSTPGSKQPDWINAGSEQYPPAAYLLGRGQSDNRGLAQDRARADLSKIFQVHVHEQSEDAVKFESGNLAGPGTTAGSASRHIATRTDQVVEGIRIAELWQDPDSGQFHALATLDRTRTANGLRQAIQGQDTATEHEVAAARLQSDLFPRIAHASQAVRIQTSRQENQRVLKIVDPTGIGIPPRYNLGSLRTDRDRLLEQVHVELRVLNDPLGGVEPILQGAITEAGFQHDAQAPYVLEADVELDGFEDQNGWHWYRGGLQINLVDKTKGRSQGSHRWGIKVAAQNPDIAAQRARDAIDKALSTELRAVLIGFGAPE